MEKAQISVIIKRNFSKDSKNIFFVSTAMHLFNAIEAQNYFQTTNNVLVLLFYSAGNQDEINVRKYLHLFPYNKLIIYEPKREKKYHYLNLRLVREIDKFEYKYLFLGYFSANLRRFACNIRCKDIFLFDDGTYTIALHEELYGEKQSPRLIKKYSEKQRKTWVRQIKFLNYDLYRKFYFRINGYKNDFSTIKIGFFTIFNIFPYGDEKIIHHSLKKTKEIFFNDKSGTENISKSVFFLGQPLSNVMDISDKEYMKYIQKLQNLYFEKNLCFTYVIHRSEKDSIVKQIKSLESDNFNVLKLDIPIEIYFLLYGIRAEHVASFFSSGLFTLKALFPSSNILAYKIKYDVEERKDLEAIYRKMKNNCIQVRYIEEV